MRFLLAHPAHFLALGLGSGLSPTAPGTVGTLWGWLAFVVLQLWLTPLGMGLLIAGAARGLVGLHGHGAPHGRGRPGQHRLGRDRGHLIVLWLAMPMGFWGQLIAFALFRYFDAAKPGPVAWADQQFKGFLAGAVALASCSTTWWPRSARCWSSHLWRHLAG